jgi:hypothetical protein
VGADVPWVARLRFPIYSSNRILNHSGIQHISGKLFESILSTDAVIFTLDLSMQEISSTLFTYKFILDLSIKEFSTYLGRLRLHQATEQLLPGRWR